MSFCPKCGKEYESDIEECPDCHESLVESLPAEDDPGKDDHDVELVLLYSTREMINADMLKGALENEDIQFLLKRGVGIHAQFGASLPGTHGLFKIWVAKEDFERASEIKEQVIGSNEE